MVRANKGSRSRRQAENADDVEDGYFSTGSQDSDSSDETLVTSAFQKIHAAWDKKKKEKEKKFLKSTKADLERIILSKMALAAQKIKSCDQLTEEFVDRYAQSEDKVRKLWVQIQTEFQNLAAVAEAQHESRTASAKQTERLQIDAMTCTKGGVEEYENIFSLISDDTKT